MFELRRERTTMIDPERALAGRPQEMPVAPAHTVLADPIKGPFPACPIGLMNVAQ